MRLSAGLGASEASGKTGEITWSIDVLGSVGTVRVNDAKVDPSEFGLGSDGGKPTDPGDVDGDDGRLKPKPKPGAKYSTSRQLRDEIDDVLPDQ